MNTEMLLKEFTKIRDYEVRAKCFYDHFIDQMEDGEIKRTLISIRDDEIRHIRVAQELIDMVS